MRAPSLRSQVGPAIALLLALVLPAALDAQPGEPAPPSLAGPAPGALVRVWRRDTTARDGLRRTEGTLERAGPDSLVVRGREGTRTAWEVDSVLSVQQGHRQRGTRTRVLQALKAVKE